MKKTFQKTGEQFAIARIKVNHRSMRVLMPGNFYFSSNHNWRLYGFFFRYIFTCIKFFFQLKGKENAKHKNKNFPSIAFWRTKKYAGSPQLEYKLVLSIGVKEQSNPIRIQELGVRFLE
jgi:lipid-A-disaccharide synthase-like uncharacterized protein